MTRPNVVLICVDEWRGDALSCAGHPYVETPHLDELARSGVRFSSGYSATPTCVPARVALFTGQSQERHGRVGYQDGVPFDLAHPVTVQGEFRRAGYHTQAIGKMHVWPERARLGFDDVSPDADYFDHGVNCNSVVARPWDKAEELHPTSWVGTQTIEWLYRRDPTRPFFLYLSFHRPHPPYDPPAWAFDRYDALPPYQRVLGDWESDWDEFRRDGDYQTLIGDLPDRVVHRARAGYYGLMAQIDLQVNRIREALADFGVFEDTIFAFVSDHGEMMDDHRMFRKSVPYEGSARVPFIVADRASAGSVRGGVIDQIVELRDVMPTLLDLAGVPIPSSVDGVSLAPYLRGSTEPVREWLHGEHVYWDQSLQWVTDGRVKYVWGSARGVEQLFDLVADPGELHNLVDERPDLLALWRSRLIVELTNREEGFVADGKLITGRPVTTMLRQTRQRVAHATR